MTIHPQGAHPCNGASRFPMESVTAAPGELPCPRCARDPSGLERLSHDAADATSFLLLFIVNAISSNAARFLRGAGSIVGAPVHVTPTIAWESAVDQDRGNLDERE
jgi:hypothetical protein